MAESKSKKLPQFNSNQELIEFFDTHDMGEYESELPEEDFEVDIKRKHYLVSVDGDLMSQLLESPRKPRQSGSAIETLTILSEDEIHLEDFHDYIP